MQRAENVFMVSSKAIHYSEPWLKYLFSEDIARERITRQHLSICSSHAFGAKNECVNMSLCLFVHVYSWFPNQLINFIIILCQMSTWIFVKNISFLYILDQP